VENGEGSGESVMKECAVTCRDRLGVYKEDGWDRRHEIAVPQPVAVCGKGVWRGRVNDIDGSNEGTNSARTKRLVSRN
jgi:hypothetical protein